MDDMQSQYRALHYSASRGKNDALLDRDHRKLQCGWKAIVMKTRGLRTEAQPERRQYQVFSFLSVYGAKIQVVFQ